MQCVCSLNVRMARASFGCHSLMVLSHAPLTTVSFELRFQSTAYTSAVCSFHARTTLLVLRSHSDTLPSPHANARCISFASLHVQSYTPSFVSTAAISCSRPPFITNTCCLPL